VEKYGCTVVLKGSETVVAFPDGGLYVCPVGNPGMATGGSGDVLAGIIGGLLGQLPVEQAVVYGVLIHGGAGDLCAKELGEYSMLPSDMIEALPRVMKNITY
jgi:NAD(P)H-hydrate epimerase